MSEINAMEAL
jgi:serine/threonine protein kinase